MENLLWQTDNLKAKHCFAYPVSGSVAEPHVAAADIARVAAHWLVEADWDGANPLQLLGPRELSYDQIAIRFAPMGPEPYRSILQQQGFSQSAA